MNFIRIDDTNMAMLESFLLRAGESLRTFRYFVSRPLSVIHNHLCTWVIEDAGKVEAYGHLDCEGEIIWLGIAVTQEARGQGFGRQMMRKLMESAISLGVQKVRLSVDDVNEVAVRLYKNAGFQLIEKRGTYGIYEWKNERP